MNKENPFKLISSKEVYKNPWISVREDAVVRPGGKDGIFGVVTMLEGVTVLPITDDGFVYLTHEYAYAIEAVSTEIISGGVDAGETALDAAKRELQEEVGLVAQKWTHVSHLNPFTSVVKSVNHMYIAEELSEVERNLDEGEMIQVQKVPFKEVLQMVMDGEIAHAASSVAILKASQLGYGGA
ncbi:MAG: 8-oxo-dGTP pyrophosphatase MutT (NUDIX family) [Acidimicrobiales bacterium]|jgi:8-oxo-dGTP pyrophosphatase MutT (NUDIX family)